MLRLGWVLLALSLALGCSNGESSSIVQPMGMGGAAGTLAPAGQGGGGGEGGTGASAGASGGGAGTGGAGGTSTGGMSGDVPAADASVDAPGDSGGEMPDEVTSTRGVIIPTAEWTCGLPEGIPAPETGERVLDVELELEPVLALGATPYGERTIRVARGGRASGELDATVIEGGLDWELSLPSGARELETRHILRASDGALIYMRGCGAGSGDATRLVMTLEVAGNSAHAAFRQGLYLATREVADGTGRFSIYRMPEGAPSPSTPSLTIERTAADRALRPQVWNCTGPAAGESAGAQIIEATVAIGGSLSVGATQLGSRNIIPITGGTFRGLGSASSLRGDVIPGGADFQLTPPGGSFELEARYTLRADDGTLIAVRNCGRVGGTTPEFETALDSPYAFLNDGRYFGRIGISIGAVIISVFESNR